MDLKINITIQGKELSLNIAEARELFDTLENIFGKDDLVLAPIFPDPFPDRPYKDPWPANPWTNPWTNPYPSPWTADPYDPSPIIWYSSQTEVFNQGRIH